MNIHRLVSRHSTESRRRRRLRIGAWSAGLLVGGVTVWTADHFFYYSTLERNLRTVVNAVIVGLDYRFNFNSENAEHIDKLHERSAKRILQTCIKNGGLYIKFGQQIASLNGVSPPEYSRAFRVLYDDAPSVPYSDVRSIICKDFKVSDPSELFAEFSKDALASASIAQVHRARLKDGTSVAVKVQKPAISNQIGWDLFTFRTVLTVFGWAFDLPLTFSSQYVEKHTLQETDFLNEARNCKEAAKLLEENPVVADRAYIPKVFDDFTSGRVLTMEWIDGIRFGDLLEHKDEFPVAEIMETVVDVFSDQIFRTGFVHADPHQGNILIRKNPEDPKRNQVVLLDHGLYIRCSEKFRHEYALLWKSLFLRDTETLVEIGKAWGIQDIDIFASSTLQRQWKDETPISEKSTAAEIFEFQKKAQSRVRTFLSNTDLLPRELIYIGRNLNIVRSNNKFLGSPVNRINMIANWAVKQLGTDWKDWARSPSANHSNMTFQEPSMFDIVQQMMFVVRSRFNYWTFQAGLFLSSVTFQVVDLWRGFNRLFFGKQVAGFEEILDSQMRASMKQQYGVTVDEDAFDVQ
ncbi:hypothetical protein HK096_007512 [Nowakowskiella sp. JEL0078]|nr:hypothetical protein HK096_007512 [Nowakowskiella sp. JEL0078]